jgi:hypothetical protein
VFIGEIQIRPQRIQPLRARKCPEREGITGRLPCAAVVDGFVGRKQRNPAEQAQRGVHEVCNIARVLLSGFAEPFVGHELIDEIRAGGTRVIPKATARSR